MRLVAVSFLFKSHSIEPAELHPFGLHGEAQLAITLRLGCLALERRKSLANLIDNIVEPKHVLVYSLHSTFGFDFFSFESRNASGFFEDAASILWRCLEQSIYFALLNETVRINSHSGPAKKILDIFEAAWLAIDPVLAFSAPEDPATNLDFICIVVEDPLRIVQYQDDFGAVGRLAPTLSRALENDVRHIGAAQGFCTLSAQNPFHSIDNIRFSGTIGPDNYCNPFWEIESRSICKTLEAN